MTEHAATILGLEGYGLAPGCHADFVLHEATDPIEAIRLRLPRLAVVRRGKVIARAAPAASEVSGEIPAPSGPAAGPLPLSAA